MSVTDLQSGTGYAHTVSGSVMSIPDVLRMAEGTYPLLMLFDGKGLPLHWGRGRYRLASAWQRLACIAADRGCTRPGCEAPATMCAVHHMVPWLLGGRTDIDNLTLVLVDFRWLLYWRRTQPFVPSVSSVGRDG